MTGEDRGPPDDADTAPEPRRPWASLAGLALIVGIVVAGYFVAAKLKAVSELQDCVMSGRTNCAPIATPGD